MTHFNSFSRMNYVFVGNNPTSLPLKPTTISSQEDTSKTELYNTDANVIQTPPQVERLQSIPAETMESTPVTTTDSVLPTSVQSVQFISTEENKPTTNMIHPNKSTASIPVRYGVAATIPYDDEFDLKTVLQAKSSVPFADHSNNELREFLEKSKSKKIVTGDPTMSDILQASSRGRANLVEVARKAQQEFLASIILD